MTSKSIGYNIICPNFLLWHDGGTETALEDIYALVNANDGVTNIDLGDLDVTEVEGVKFYVGVDPDHNHLDPASYSADHPLAPQFPSMHWGWASGYRFLAFEGKGGSSYDQTFEIHALGDGNYLQSEVMFTNNVTAESGIINIDITGDYVRGLDDIAVNSGLIIHGFDGFAKKALLNWKEVVFQPMDNASAAVDFSEVQGFDAFPNPSTDGTATIIVEANGNLMYQVSISDVLGRQVQQFDEVKSNSPVQLNIGQPGLYIVNLVKEGHAVIAKKLVVD